MMKSRNLFLKIYKKVDDRQTDRQTNIQDLRIYATSRRIKKSSDSTHVLKYSVA